MNMRVKKWVFRGVLLLFGAGVSAGFAEAVIRWKAPVATESVDTTVTRKAELYGWAVLPSRRGRFTDPVTRKRSFFRINSQGWKDVEHTFEKPPNTLRIVVIGDSHTYGKVHFNSLYTRLVERRLKHRGLRQAEVISMAVGGWGTDQELEVLKNEGVRYEPDLVIYQYSRSDLQNNMMPDHPDPRARSRIDSLYASKQIRYHLDRNGNLVRIVVKPKQSRLPWLLRHSVLARRTYCLLTGKDEETKADGTRDGFYVKGLMEVIEEPAAARIDPVPGGDGCRKWPLLRALTVEMRNVAHEAGADFAVFSLRREPKLQKLCRKNRIHFIPHRRTYSQYPGDIHATPRGNRQMAYDIVEDLLSWDAFLEHAERSGEAKSP